MPPYQPYYIPTQEPYPHPPTPDRSEQDSGVVTPHSVVSDQTPPYTTTSPQPSVSGTVTPVYPDSCYTESYEFSFEAAVLHRQLQRAITAGKAAEGLTAYRAMESLGKVINVTETSALVEQLVRADLMREAGEVTRAMLLRDTHPLPKIFR